ncbi:putative baseplate wedge subunit and tail pin [Aeromonas phage P19]|nr:putative baseplate wedge subunit and tail pin [Aeromonas phage P19]
MKQQIIIGNRVDDGTGDYLRKGGQKTNDNFNELYYNLGDGNIPHAAGAWKPYSDHTKTLSAIMGQAWVINTTTGRITVNLPSGTPADYGKVIRVRDVMGTWGGNPVILVPGGFNTIKGSSGTHRLENNFMDVELVYCSPGNWDYVPSKYVGEIRSNDIATVAKKEFIATEGQTDFQNIFSSGYNRNSINVYKRGNILYYGQEYGPESNYGSIVQKTVADPAKIDINPVQIDSDRWGTIVGKGTRFGTVEGNTIVSFYSKESDKKTYIKFDLNKKPLNEDRLVCVYNDKTYLMKFDKLTSEYVSVNETPDILARMKIASKFSYYVGVSKITDLDGYTIKLEKPCEAGDVVVIETFLDGLATYRSSYETATIRVYSDQYVPVDYVSETGRRFVGDLSAKFRFNLSEFGFQPSETFNPKTLEMIVNGRQLVKSGQGDIPFFTCEGADSLTQESCIANGGVWVPTGVDFGPIEDENGYMRDIVVNEPFNHEDVITIRWFNNDIGSLLELDDIIKETDKKYINTVPVTLTGKIRYSDPFNPTPKTVQPDPNDLINVPANSIAMLFDMFYPVGTIYENAHNPNNPATYMGIGTWVRWAEGKVVAGWNSQNPNDPIYGLNNQDLDINGQPRHSAGSIFGENDVTLAVDNTPGTKSTEKALIADPNGDVLVGGCQYDPDESGPGYKKYREDYVYTRPNETVNPFSVIQPTTTAHRWLRVE